MRKFIYFCTTWSRYFVITYLREIPFEIEVRLYTTVKYFILKIIVKMLQLNEYWNTKNFMRNFTSPFQYSIIKIWTAKSVTTILKVKIIKSFTYRERERCLVKRLIINTLFGINFTTDIVGFDVNFKLGLICFKPPSSNVKHVIYVGHHLVCWLLNSLRPQNCGWRWNWLLTQNQNKLLLIKTLQVSSTTFQINKI